MEKTAVKKILIVVLDNIGDAVMATAILKPIKRLYPHAQIGLWTKEYAADLFQDQSLIDFHHHSDPFWDKSPGQGKGALKAFWKTFLEIRRARYDLAYVLNAEWRRSMACLLAGIPERVGLNRRKSRFFLTRAVPVSDVDQHFIEDHLSLLPHEGDDCFPRLELNTKEKVVWNDWSTRVKWEKGSFVAIHPFSGDERKTWPMTCWAELVQSLVSDGRMTRFLFFYGPGEEQRLQTLTSTLSPLTFHICGGRLSYLKALVANAMVFVGGDSGPGHMAAALEVPVVSLFAGTDPLRCRPIGHGAVKIVQKNPVQSITVSEVKEAIESLVEAQHPCTDAG